MRQCIQLCSLLCLWLMMIGCSGGGHSATTPEAAGNQSAPPNGVWGHYEVSLSPSGDVQFLPVDERTGARVVDPYVEVAITASNFNPETRIWDIDATFHNRTNYTAYGLWVAFYNLNGNAILDQDGFATAENGGDLPAAPGFGQRKPVIAIGKGETRRPFLGNATLSSHVRIRWPEGATNFHGLRYYLDASFPGARQQPIVEQLTADGGVVTAYVKDWQNNPSPLQVFAQLLQQTIPMNDQGLVPDVEANDEVWSGALPPSEDGIVVVKASDPGGFHFENQIGFGVSAPPCSDGQSPTQFSPYRDGQHSGINDSLETVITDQAAWDYLWSRHMPGTEAPDVNFDCHNVFAVFLGSYPSGGYGVMPYLVPTAPLLPELQYVATQPGDDCERPDGATQPWRMWLGPKLNDVAWRRSWRTNECYNESNVPFQTIFKGVTDNGEQAARTLVLNSFDDMSGVIAALGLPLSELNAFVNFDTESVVVVSQGSRPTRGHMACVEHVNTSGPPPAPGDPINGITVRWAATSPGEQCEVDQRVGTPVHIGVVPKVPGGEFVRTDRAGEPCTVGGDCEPFTSVYESQTRDGADAFQRVFSNPNDFGLFWSQHFPGSAPEVNFNEFTVVALGLEQFPTGGHTLAIECLRWQQTGIGHTLTVKYVHTAPGEHCEVPQGSTRPTLIVKLPRVDHEHLEATFERVNTTA
ncbi:MAG: protease complex subunit PrcB family protein, partial [bacterium]